MCATTSCARRSRRAAALARADPPADDLAAALLAPAARGASGLLRWSETEEELFGEQDLLEKPALARCREARFRLSALVSELEAHAESG